MTKAELIERLRELERNARSLLLSGPAARGALLELIPEIIDALENKPEAPSDEGPNAPCPFVAALEKDK